MDATTLRVILLIVGIAFLVALFLWERNRTTRADAWRMSGASPRKKEKREPNFGIDDEGDSEDWQPGQDTSDWDYPDAPQAKDESSAAATRHRNNQDDQERPTGEMDPADIAGIVTNTEKGPIIQVFVVARDGNLSGRDILAAAGRHLLIIGSKDIFHRIDGDPNQPRTLFSMANLVQPGNFPLYPDPHEAMADFETRGIALFTQMHGEYQDIEALDAMLTTAKSLARELTAEIEDAQHRPISIKRIESLRNAVIDYADHDTNRGHGDRTER